MPTVPEHSDWRSRAHALVPEGRAFVDGEYRGAGSGATYADHSPIDGRLLGAIAACDAADVDRTVRAARRVFEHGAWSRASPAHRKQVLLRFARVIEDHAEELALLESLDVGKPIRFALGNDVPGTANCVRWYAEAIDKVYGQVAPTGPEAVGMLVREPVGVVAAIVPWNFPLLIAAWKFAPALAAGNSVILKPAEQSPLSALRLAALAHDAGLPAGTFQVLPGDGPTAGAALAAHPGVDLVTFTGSTAVGQRLLATIGGSTLKAVSLECGGKSPNLIFPDVADLDAAAHAAAQAIFYNAGQVCVAASRLLVHERIADEFVERLASAARAFRPGDPLDPQTTYGAIGSGEHLARILGHLSRARAEGAHLAFGGGTDAPVPGGSYLEPTMLDRVRPHMAIARDEVFGPVLAVLRFGDEAEAVALANDSDYGLQACVWTESLQTAHSVASRLRAGTVAINAVGVADLTMPVTGWKQSGFGSDRSLLALDKYCRVKTIYVKLRPG